MGETIPLEAILNGSDETLYDVATQATGPQGELPLSGDLLAGAPSGDLFGLVQSAGMGWDPAHILADEYLLLSHQGGIRDSDGKPIALGYHTGQYELGLLMEAAAKELRDLGCMPFAGFCTDPCDGRT